MKPWKKCLQLLAALFVYLSCGAFMILKLEEGHVSRSQQEFFGQLAAFVQNHYACGVTPDEVLSLLERTQVARSHNAFFSDMAYHEQGVRQVWSWPNSILFTSSVVTTIGYGRLAPISVQGQIFCIWFAVLGIPLCCAMLSAIGDTSNALWQHFVGFSEKCFSAISSKKARRVLMGAITVTNLWVLLILLPSAVFTETEPEWSLWRAQYFCFVSFSTIGFGDVIYGLEKEGDSYILDWVYKMGILVFLFLGMSVISVVFKGVLHSQRKNIVRAKASIRRKHWGRSRKYDLTLAEAGALHMDQSVSEGLQIQVSRR